MNQSINFRTHQKATGHFVADNDDSVELQNKNKSDAKVHTANLNVTKLPSKTMYPYMFDSSLN